MTAEERREQIQALLAEEIAENLGPDYEATDLVSHWVAVVGVSSINGGDGYGWISSVTGAPTPPAYVQRGLVVAWLDQKRALEVAHHVHTEGLE